MKERKVFIYYYPNPEKCEIFMGTSKIGTFTTLPDATAYAAKNGMRIMAILTDC